MPEDTLFQRILNVLHETFGTSPHKDEDAAEVTAAPPSDAAVAAAPALSERQQRAAERILEDEGLTGDLTDTQARPLIVWASQRAAAVAVDPARSDEDVSQTVTAIRRAVLRTASAAAAEQTAEELIALAETHLEAIEQEKG